MNKNLVLFDFDGTLTKSDTFPEFIFFSKGYLKGLGGFILFSPYVLLFLLKQINGARLKEKLISFYFKGSNQQALNNKGKEFIEKLISGDQLKKEVMQSMQDHIANGDEVCIVSASIDIWVAQFCKKFNLSCLCTELNFKDGFCLGTFKTPNCNGIEKAIRVKAKYKLNEYAKIIAYGNSSGDKELFSLANETFYIKD